MRMHGRIGVGIARGGPPGGREGAYLTEILVQPVDDGTWSSRTPEGRAQEAIATARRLRSLAPLASDARLDAMAREVARDMLRRDHPSPGDLAGRALALGAGSRPGGPGEVAVADSFVGGTPEDAARSPNAVDARFRRFGVGVVRGDSARFGAGLYWIAVVYTN